MNPHYPLVAARARYTCEYCRAPQVVYNFRFEIEHITPRSRGGSDAEENLALACHSCNLYKSNHVSAVDEDMGNEVGLFNPRRDDWEEHFSLVLETGEIEGLTPCGRATVARLRMNGRVQLGARRAWVRLGLMGQD